VLVFQCWSVLFTQQNGEKMSYGMSGGRFQHSKGSTMSKEEFMSRVRATAKWDLSHREDLIKEFERFDPAYAELVRTVTRADEAAVAYCRTKLEGK
jgi:hypothetical protein